MNRTPERLELHRDSFALFTPDEALAILVCLLFICWLADRLQVFA